MRSNEHEWIEVRHRRWCLTCAAFQQKTRSTGWQPRVGEFCPWSTVYAQRKLSRDPATRAPSHCTHYACQCAHAERLAQMSDRASTLREAERLLAEAVAATRSAVPCLEVQRLRQADANRRRAWTAPP